MIHNIFNKNLLTRCNEPQFKGQHVEPVLLLIMRKKNIKLKKYRSTGNKVEKHNTWCIKKVMGMSMINKLWNQSCLI